jgi:hypothetical protein
MASKLGIGLVTLSFCFSFSYNIFFLFLLIMTRTLLQADGFCFGFIEYESHLSTQPSMVLKRPSSPNYLQKKAAFTYNKEKMMSKYLQTI